MEILDGGSVYALLMKKYSRRPTGWSFTVSPSSRYGFDAFVTNSEEAWHLKLDTVFKPSPLVVGAKADLDLSKLNSLSPVSFGYRRMTPEVLSGLSAGETDPSGLAALLSRIEPVMPREPGSYAEGPFVFTRESATGMTQGQKELDDRLSSELRKLVRNRYPSYG